MLPGIKSANIVAVSLQAVILTGAIFAALRRDWFDVFVILGILLLTLLPTVLGRHFKVFTPVRFQAFTIAFIFAALFLGEVRGYYTRFWWWDMVLHSSSSIHLGLFGFLLVFVMNEENKVSLNINPALVAIFSFAFSVAIGCVWEIFEFLADQTIGTNMQKSGLPDTMKDLIVDTAGAAIVAVVGYVYLRNRSTPIVATEVEQFVRDNPQIFHEDDPA